VTNMKAGTRRRSLAAANGSEAAQVGGGGDDGKDTDAEGGGVWAGEWSEAGDDAAADAAGISSVARSAGSSAVADAAGASGASAAADAPFSPSPEPSADMLPVVDGARRLGATLSGAALAAFQRTLWLSLGAWDIYGAAGCAVGLPVGGGGGAPSCRAARAPECALGGTLIRAGVCRLRAAPSWAPGAPDPFAACADAGASIALSEAAGDAALVCSGGVGAGAAGAAVGAAVGGLFGQAGAFAAAAGVGGILTAVVIAAVQQRRAAAAAAGAARAARRATVGRTNPLAVRRIK
jgi:hypothetical protein